MRTADGFAGVEWRKSSRSGGQSNCVEVGLVGAGLAWRTSSRSGGSGNCVEVATNLAGLVAVRDSKRPDGPALAFSPYHWKVFLAEVRAGEYDPRP